jgi:hypothetical protein
VRLKAWALKPLAHGRPFAVRDGTVCGYGRWVGVVQVQWDDWRPGKPESWHVSKLERLEETP